MKLTFIITPGHGYLKVSLSQFRKSGMDANLISGYSGMTNTNLFLEEDCDAPLFLRHLENLDIPYEITDTHQTRVTSHNFESNVVNQ